MNISLRKLEIFIIVVIIAIIGIIYAFKQSPKLAAQYRSAAAPLER